MIKYLRQSVLFFLVLVLGFGVAQAQTWPTGPIKIVVPFPPGGSVDMVARLVAKRLTDSLGQPFLVDNRAGASGNIAAEFVAKTNPDGNTLFVTSSGVLAANMHLLRWRHRRLEVRARRFVIRNRPVRTGKTTDSHRGAC